jgi:HD-GYP domain-containing protein (c-di-GMP phosphodiesterase class II)
MTEVLGALSLATDLANGNPMESALRSCLLAARLARDAGAPAADARDAYNGALLRHIGCTSFAHEETAAFGGDLEARRVFAPVDLTRSGETVSAAVRGLDLGARRLGALALKARGLRRDMATARCEVAARLATRIGVGSGVALALEQSYERWDGRGGPRGLAGDELALAARVLHIAVEVELHHRLGGGDAARDLVRRRAGGQLDPELARLFLDGAPAYLAELEEAAVWDAVLAADPGPRLPRPPDLGEIAAAFADYVDLKSVHTLGHSSGVAALAEAAGRAAGLDAAAVTALRHAALLHDLGRASVSTALWEKPGRLTTSEWERVRLHPYFTERILVRAPLLAPLAPIAGAHHERVDGSGYPKGAGGAALPIAPRILAAADVYHALTEARPHRPALSAGEAARVVEAEVGDGRLDRKAAAAVLEAAGQRRPRARAGLPRGLSEREVQVLALVARGLSNKEIACRLGISSRTAQHHVIHIYDKIGVASRAAAALFAMEHDLLDP